MIIKGKKTDNFTTILNFVLYDKRLSFKAKGIIIYLLTKIKKWKVSVQELAQASKEGEKAVRAGLKELQKYGYAKKVMIRNKNGSQITDWDYIIYEDPKLAKQHDNTENALYYRNLQVQNVQKQNAGLIKIENNQKLNTTTTPAPKIKARQEQTAVAAAVNFDELFNLVPKNLRHKSIENIIIRASGKGFKGNYIKSAIQYTNDNSNGGIWQKYMSYLSLTLDNGWAVGYESDFKQERQEDKELAFLESRRQMPTVYLEMEAKHGCKVCQQVLQERLQQ